MLVWTPNSCKGISSPGPWARRFPTRGTKSCLSTVAFPLNRVSRILIVVSFRVITLRMHNRKMGRHDGRQALTTPMFGSMADHSTIPKLDPGYPSILSNLKQGMRNAISQSKSDHKHCIVFWSSFNSNHRKYELTSYVPRCRMFEQ